MEVTGLQVIEAVTMVLGLLSATLLSLGNGKGWPLGALMVTLSSYVYWERTLYGSASVQLFFLATQLLGWWRWSRTTEKDLRVTSRRLGWTQRLGVLILGSAAWLLAVLILTANGGSQIYLDAFVTVLSLIAQIAMVYGFAENWLIWFFVNLGIIWLSITGGLWFFAFLSLVYLGVSINGWRQWSKPGSEIEARQAGHSEESLAPK